MGYINNYGTCDWRQYVVPTLSFTNEKICTLFNLKSNLKKGRVFFHKKHRYDKKDVKLEFCSTSQTYIKLTFAEAVK